MIKITKRKSSSVPSEIMPDQAEAHMALQIDKIQQQLYILEKKLDTLINQSSEKPFKEKYYSKPSERYERSHRKDRDNRDNSFRERSFTKATCADCNEKCEVPFKPTGERPVYCKECFSKRNPGNSSKGKYDKPKREGGFSKERHFDKRQGSESRSYGKDKKSFPRKRKESV